MSSDHTIEHLIPVLNLLSDGEYHSGEEIGSILGVSRAAVWKQLKKLETFGCNIESNKGVGYRIKHPIFCLDVEKLKSLADRHPLVSSVEVMSSIESTNSYLLSQKASSLFAGKIVIAEMQTSGKGRRGRTWQSPFGRNIYLSLGWRVTEGISALEGLSLAVGVVIVQILNNLAVRDIELKWPNDLIWRGRKLGGILIELDGDLSGDCNVVVGVGLNVDMSDQDYQAIDQPWVDLKEIALESGCNPLDRTDLASQLIVALVDAVSTYSEKGFEEYQDAWNAHNYSKNKEITITSGQSSVSGIHRGVSETGALILETQGQITLHNGGELSLRLVDATTH